MLILTISRQEFLDTLEPIVEHYTSHSAKDIKIDTTAFLCRYAEPGEIYGLQTSYYHEEWLSCSYHVLLGELLIVLRNNHVGQEEEALILSDFDRKVQSRLDTNEYL